MNNIIVIFITAGCEQKEEVRTSTNTNHTRVILSAEKRTQKNKRRGQDKKASKYLTAHFKVNELLIGSNRFLDIENLLSRQFNLPTPYNTAKEMTCLSTLDSPLHTQKTFLDILNYALEKLYKNNDLKMPELAAKIAMSERNFYRKLKANLKMNPTEYVRRFRLSKARLLLAEGKPVSDVSIDVGFSSHSYFGRCFRAQYGCSPSEYSQMLLMK